LFWCGWQVHEQMYQLDRAKKSLRDQVYRLQKTSKRYQTLQAGAYQAPDPAQVDQGLARAEDQRASLSQASDSRPVLRVMRTGKRRLSTLEGEEDGVAVAEGFGWAEGHGLQATDSSLVAR
jgi:hypothetical protein